MCESPSLQAGIHTTSYIRDARFFANACSSGDDTMVTFFNPVCYSIKFRRQFFLAFKVSLLIILLAGLVWCGSVFLFGGYEFPANHKRDLDFKQ